MALHKDVRRQRALEEFRRRLEEMSADEIRAQLEARRIRSEERVQMAEAAIRRHEKRGTKAKPDMETAASAAAAGAATSAGKGAGNGAAEGAGEASESDAGRGAAAGGAAAAAPVARQVGRMLGMGLGIASIAALALFVIRR